MDTPTGQPLWPIGPRSFGAILGDSFALYRENGRELLTIAAVVLVPIALWTLVAIRAPLSPADFQPPFSSFTSPSGILYAMQGMQAVSYLFELVLLFQWGALTIATGRLLVGLPSGASGSFASSGRRYLPLLGTALLILLVVYGAVLGVVAVGALVTAVAALLVQADRRIPVIVAAASVATIVTIALAVYLYVRWSLFIPVLMLEGTRGGRETMRRSWRLTSGRWWRTFGVVAVAGLIVAVPISILSAAVGAAMFVATRNATLVLAIVQTTSVVTSPYFVCVIVLLYFDYRTRDEALDAPALRASVSTATGGMG